MMNGEMNSTVIREISLARMTKAEKEEMKIEFLKIDEKVLSDNKKEELKKKLEDKKIMKTTEIRKLRSEVKKVMWKYYSENKSSLPDYISEFREEIIVELMKGQSVEVVFDSYGGGSAPSGQAADIAA